MIYKLARFCMKFSVLLVGYSAIVVAWMFPIAWFGIAVIAIMCCRKYRQLHAFGTARWANSRDMRPMLNGGNGLLVGSIEDKPARLEAAKALFDSSVPDHIAARDCIDAFQKKPPQKLVRLNKAVHTAVFAPTGVGKGVSIVLPHLLTCADSMVVIDFKGELAQITADARRKMGHKVVILDPWNMVTQTPDTFNVLDCIDKDDPNALDACRSLAAAMVIRDQEKGDGVHFLDNAESGIGALIALVVLVGNPGMRSLQMVADLVSSPENWQKSIEVMTGSTAWGGLLARLGESLKHLKDRELASTMTTINRFLRFLSTPALAASTVASTFDPADLLNKKMTCYLVIPPEHMTANSALLRLWIGSMLRAVVRGGLQEKKKVQFVLDEAASLGPMNEITDAVDKYRGYGVRLVFLYQALGQLKKCWPDGQDLTLLSNVTQVYFGVNDNETAKYVSERLGKSTIVVTSGGTGTSVTRSSSQNGEGSTSVGFSTNDNWQQSGRELLQPNEIMNLSERIAVTFTPGVPPIWTTLVRYYEAGFKNVFTRPTTGFTLFCKALCYLLATGFMAAALTSVAMEQEAKRQERRELESIQFFK